MSITFSTMFFTILVKDLLDMTPAKAWHCPATVLIFVRVGNKNCTNQSLALARALEVTYWYDVCLHGHLASYRQSYSAFGYINELLQSTHTLVSTDHLKHACHLQQQSAKSMALSINKCKDHFHGYNSQ